MQKILLKIIDLILYAIGEREIQYLRRNKNFLYEFM
jgi:hypothetical protein